MNTKELIAVANEGAAEGRKLERERILRICKEISVPYVSEHTNELGDVVFISDLISYMNDKDYE